MIGPETVNKRYTVMRLEEWHLEFREICCTRINISRTQLCDIVDRIKSSPLESFLVDILATYFCFKGILNIRKMRSIITQFPIRIGPKRDSFYGDS